mmetsp:Transcript_55651/g.161258  ORF Transcript_55651/g.161258 Transcript_55651/m.161258 type:complete len:300 (+) Transcript_55651:71-970(+)
MRIAMEPVITTLMFRRLPRRFSPDDLLEAIERITGQGTVDYLLLPWQSDSVRNLGYAFVNFVSAEAACRAKREMDGIQLAQSTIRIEDGNVQSLAANIERMRILLEEGSLGIQSLPIIFIGGMRTDFHEALQLIAAAREGGMTQPMPSSQPDMHFYPPSREQPQLLVAQERLQLRGQHGSATELTLSGLQTCATSSRAQQQHQLDVRSPAPPSDADQREDFALERIFQPGSHGHDDGHGGVGALDGGGNVAVLGQRTPCAEIERPPALEGLRGEGEACARRPPDPPSPAAIWPDLFEAC